MSPIKIDALMHSVQTLSITPRNMADGMALISSGILWFRLRKSAGRAYNTLLYKQSHEKKSQADRSAKRAGQDMSP
jgi:hypothetical protein